MLKLSDERKKFYQNAVSTFHSWLPGSPAEEHLASRGLLEESVAEEVNKYRLGYVRDPLPGFEQYVGMLAIPYLRRHPKHGWMCVSLRFRSLREGSKNKYLTMGGDDVRLFNTPALRSANAVVGICEGEIDAITATLCGVPTVGVPGAGQWEDHWGPLFTDLKAVYVFADGDEDGRKFARKMAKRFGNAVVIDCGDGRDVNSIYQDGGITAVQERIPKVD